MNRDDITKLIRDNLAELTDNDDVAITETTVAEDVDGWDSIVHIKLLFAIEAQLGLTFEPGEMVAPANVGELIDMIQSKL